ncbi:MAG: GGDEF domain-containing protein [Lachnospiraceae bacterium]|nr:GGDEF domain-containing protein [Lachnospiraceae bacterium]MCM1239390.1 GGDEF domain-containing protein [Lachnospiraceae bacterium]
MKKVIEWSYLAVLIVCVGVFLFMFATFRMDVSQRHEPEGFAQVADYQREIVKDAECPTGQKSVYTFNVGQLPDSDDSLIFFSLHQLVTVSLDGEEIYSIKPDSGNAFGSTTGCVWNVVLLSEHDSGKQVTVEIVPVYKTSNDFVPDFFLGSRYAICRDRILAALPSIICGIFAILIGGFYIAYILYNRRNTEVDGSLLFLGVFSVLLGCWKVVDTNAFYLLIPGRVAFSYADFLLLALVPVPYCLFMRQMHSSADRHIWDVPCIASIMGTCVVIAVQFLHILDMRQMLQLIHGLLLLLAVVCVIMLVWEVKTVGLSGKLKKNFFCIVLCAVGLVLDMIIYYVTKGKFQSFLGIFNFLIYNLVLGVSTMQEAKELMKIGMQAKKLEEKAYHDQLTGLFNRTAYADDIGSGFEPEHCIVVMCDLNDLKKCNDTQGHEMGDKYIRESARIINECFGDSGRCYRMGGDEFCVLLKNRSLEDCKKRILRMKEKCERYNRENDDILIRIACGYELYDKRLDYDINDTSRRADRMMYHEKFTMKHQMAGAV